MYDFSRTFTQDSAKDVVPQSSNGAGVHWLNAINPELFTEKDIRYVKIKKRIKKENIHHTAYKLSYSYCRCTYACPHKHAKFCMLGHLTHTSTHCMENHMCVCVRSYGLVLCVWIWEQTSPVLRASSLSCCGNVTQMQAGKDNNKK